MGGDECEFFCRAHVHKQSQNDCMNHLVDQTKSTWNFSNLFIISAIFHVGMCNVEDSKKNTVNYGR